MAIKGGLDIRLKRHGCKRLMTINGDGTDGRGFVIASFRLRLIPPPRARYSDTAIGFREILWSFKSFVRQF